MHLVFRSLICGLDDNYVPHLPSRQMLSDKLIPAFCSEMTSNIHMQLSLSTCHAVSLELWTTQRWVRTNVIIVGIIIIITVDLFK